jgi:hypothetical protein
MRLVIFNALKAKDYFAIAAFMRFNWDRFADQAFKVG